MKERIAHVKVACFLPALTWFKGELVESRPSQDHRVTCPDDAAQQPYETTLSSVNVPLAVRST